MPYKRARKRVNRLRRRPKRGYRKRVPKMSVVRSLGGISQSLRTKIAYSAHTTGTLANPNFLEYVFRANSITDFDYANNFGNIQPQGHDRLAALYSRYLVRYVTIIADIAAHRGDYVVGGTSSGAAAAGICLLLGKWIPDVYSAVPTVPGYIKGMPGSYCTMIGNGGSKRITWKLPLYKMYGVNVNPLTSDFGAQSDTNPTAPVWTVVRLDAPDATASITINYSISWKIVFDVDYVGPKYTTLNTV